MDKNIYFLMVTSTYNISIENIQKLQKKHLQRQVKDKHFVHPYIAFQIT